jgi:ribosomal protein L11 methyltransferase
VPEREETAVAAAALCGTLGAWCERAGLVRAYFVDRSAEALERDFRVAWRGAGGEPPAPAIEIRAFDEIDWLSRWRESARPVEAAPGLWIVPAGTDAPAAGLAPNAGRVPAAEAALPAGARAVVIRPGQGFGTGSHPTTRALLRWLAADPPGGAVLDVGTGSGVLALAALALGAPRAIGLEIDEAAIGNAAENRALNGTRRLGLVRGSLRTLRAGVRFDRVLANLDRATLERLVPELARHVAPGGRMGIAGLLEGEEDPILALADEAGLTLVDRAVEADPATGDDWWSGWLASPRS